MSTKTERLKVKEVSVNMSSFATEGSVCFRFEKTDELPELCYVFIGTDKMLRDLERRMKVNSVFELKSKTVIAFVQNNYVRGIGLDDSKEDAVKKAKIASVSCDDSSLTILAKSGNDEKIKYSFEKGSYGMKAFMVDAGVVSIEELIGKDLIFIFEDGQIVNLSVS